MTLMNQCDSCPGLIPAGVRACPHCAKPVTPSMVRRWAKRLAALAGGGALAVTLMACYGLPPCDDYVDRDGDGYQVCADGYGRYDIEEDCDDDNHKINPGAYDPFGDGVDQNCDGVDGVYEYPRPSPDASPIDALPTSDAEPLSDAEPFSDAEPSSDAWPQSDAQPADDAGLL